MTPRQILTNVRISAPVTPFSAAGDIMYDAFEEILRWHLSHGTRGLLIGADNGEHWALSEEEIRRLAETAVKVVKGSVPIYSGAWAITEHESIRRASAAAEGGADGLCVKPQSYVHAYSPPTERDVVGRFEAVYKAVPLPFMIYNSHNRTNVNISHDFLARIIEGTDVRFLKDTNADPNFILDRVMRFGETINVLVTERHFFEGMMLGGAGVVGTVIDLFGEKSDEVFKYLQMTVAERREWQMRLEEVGQAINMFGSIPACYKAAWNMIGLPAGHLRDPIRPISEQQEQSLRASLLRWGALKQPTSH